LLQRSTYGKVGMGMGIIAMLELQRALADLYESYVAPVERDYCVY
jgi:hypothetical protein